MSALIESYPWLKSLWTAWFFLMFVGIVVGVMRPSRRERWSALGLIPLNDGAPGKAPRESVHAD